MFIFSEMMNRDAATVGEYKSIELTLPFLGKKERLLQWNLRKCVRFAGEK